MKKYGILLSAEEHKRLKRMAADDGGTMQDIARDAVLAVINGNSPRPVANPPPAAHKLREAAATARALADQLAALAGGELEGDQPETITISVAVFKQMLMEATRNEPDSPVGSKVEEVERLVEEVGGTNSPPAAPDRGAPQTSRGKRSASR